MYNMIISDISTGMKKLHHSCPIAILFHYARKGDISASIIFTGLLSSLFIGTTLKDPVCILIQWHFLFLLHMLHYFYRQCLGK